MSDKMKDEHEFESWRAPHFSGSHVTSSDPYLSYYTQMLPYSSEHVPSSQAWSNGDPVPFLGGYATDPGPQHSGHSTGHYTMEAMFGSQNTYGFNSPFNAFFPSGSDPFWGNTKTTRPAPTDYRLHASDSFDYNYAPMADSIKHVESSMSGLNLDHIKSDQFANKGISGAFSVSDPKKFESIGSSTGGAVGQGPKKMTWASIASQPAKPQPKSLKSKMSSSVLTGSTSKHLPPASMEAIGTWESKNGTTVKTPPAAVPPVAPTLQPPRSAPPTQVTQQQAAPPAWTSQRPAPATRTQPYAVSAAPAVSESVALPAHPVLDKLRVENNYNPREFDLNPRNARFFIIKSYSEDDIHRSIKYSIWCSTEHGNKRLDNAFKSQDTKGPIYLLYSVNGSGHFCGMAQMMSPVDYSSSSNVWAQDKWKGQFKVKWIYVKDVPNAQLRHIRLENNENKPVTNSRDTQEVPYEKGKQVIKIMHHYRHTTSIFDDFLHYEKRQEEESQRRVDPPAPAGPRGDPKGRQWKN